jgi:hypothetical protein
MEKLTDPLNGELLWNAAKNGDLEGVKKYFHEEFLDCNLIFHLNL